MKYQDLNICDKSMKFNETSCFLENLVSCPLSHEICNLETQTYSYVVSLAGVLLRNNFKGDTFLQYDNETMALVELSTSSTALHINTKQCFTFNNIYTCRRTVPVVQAKVQRAAAT